MSKTIVLDEIYQRIDSYKEEIIELQKQLTAIPANGPSNGGDGETEKAKFLLSYLNKIGFDEIIEYNTPDKSVSSGSRPNFAAKTKGKNHKKTIWIMSHLDIVPPGDLKLWNSDPYKIKVDGDKIYGRGTEDNQQAIVSSVLAVKSLKEEKIISEYDVALLFISDEETGSKFGIQHILKENPNLFGKEDLIIVPDGGTQDGAMIEIAEKSILWVKFTTRGKQTHASKPETGINAFKAASNLAVKLESLHHTYNKKDPIFDPPISTFEPTKKEANVPNVNTIPGEDIFYFDCRVLPAYKLEEIISAIDKICKETEQQFKVKITYEFVQKEQSAPATSADSHVVKALHKAVKEVYGVDGKPMGVGGGTVAAFIRRTGCSAVVWSKVADIAHQPNEYSLISNTLGDAKVFANIFCQL